MKLNNWINSKNRELGASILEFALLIALIALLAIPAIRPIAIANNNNICKVVVLGLMNNDGLLPTEDGTCWYFDEETGFLIQAF